MKKLREMKKNNKGFSLVELIVVIAIMVVLVAVLGSTILGYIDESKYSKDITALDAIDTAMALLIADPDSDWTDAKNVCTLETLMNKEDDNGNKVNGVLRKTLSEVFAFTGEVTDDVSSVAFRNSSPVFAGITTADVLVQVVNGAVTITVPTNEDYEDDPDYTAYQSPKGSNPLTAAGGADEDDGNGGN